MDVQLKLSDSCMIGLGGAFNVYSKLMQARCGYQIIPLEWIYMNSVFWAKRIVLNEMFYLQIVYLWYI